jgi:hypothetical protein
MDNCGVAFPVSFLLRKCSLHVVIVSNFGEMSYSIPESCRYSAYSYMHAISLATQLSHLATHLSRLDNHEALTFFHAVMHFSQPPISLSSAIYLTLSK